MARKKELSWLLLVQEELEPAQSVLAAGAEELAKHRGALCSCFGMTQRDYFILGLNCCQALFYTYIYIYKDIKIYIKEARHGKLMGTF